MEQEYRKIAKGSGFMYACDNMLYRRVKTEGNIKYLKCYMIGCDGSAKLVGDQHFFLGVSSCVMFFLHQIIDRPSLCIEI